MRARMDTCTICDGVIAFERRAPNAMYAVISFVNDAGSRRSSALPAPSVWPDNVSMSTQDAAATLGTPAAPCACTTTGGLAACAAGAPFFAATTIGN